MTPETKARLGGALAGVGRFGVGHGDDCPHRYCNHDEDCEGEQPQGTPCDCFYAAFEELRCAANQATVEEP